MIAASIARGLRAIRRRLSRVFRGTTMTTSKKRSDIAAYNAAITTMTDRLERLRAEQLRVIAELKELIRKRKGIRAAKSAIDHIL